MVSFMKKSNKIGMFMHKSINESNEKNVTNPGNIKNGLGQTALYI